MLQTMCTDSVHLTIQHEYIQLAVFVVQWTVISEDLYPALRLLGTFKHRKYNLSTSATEKVKNNQP